MMIFRMAIDTLMRSTNENRLAVVEMNTTMATAAESSGGGGGGGGHHRAQLSPRRERASDMSDRRLRECVATLPLVVRTVAVLAGVTGLGPTGSSILIDQLPAVVKKSLDVARAKADKAELFGFVESYAGDSSDHIILFLVSV